MAIQILVEINLGNSKMLPLVIAHLGIVIMKCNPPLTVPFGIVGVYEIDGEVQIAHVNNFGRFKILPDK
jgi:hypothetical protein